MDPWLSGLPGKGGNYFRTATLSDRPSQIFLVLTKHCNVYNCDISDWSYYTVCAKSRQLWPIYNHSPSSVFSLLPCTATSIRPESAPLVQSSSSSNNQHNSVTSCLDLLYQSHCVVTDQHLRKSSLNSLYTAKYTENVWKSNTRSATYNQPYTFRVCI